MSISGRLLSDAVKAVPDEAFWIAGNKLALQNKVTAFERALTNDRTGAAEKLRNDIRVHVEQWLREDYAVTSALEYTKPQLLELIDAIAMRLSK
jgi:hypothetical protein